MCQPSALTAASDSPRSTRRSRYRSVWARSTITSRPPGRSTRTASSTAADLIIEIDDVAAPGAVLVLAPIPTDDLARQEAVLVEHGYRVRVVTAERFYSARTDLLDPRLVEVAAAAAGRQAADLRAWWTDRR
jgi:hypothetical protein